MITDPTPWVSVLGVKLTQRRGEQPPLHLAHTDPASEPPQPSLTVTITTDDDSQGDRSPPANPGSSLFQVGYSA